MKLKVELAIPGRELINLGFQAIEEVINTSTKLHLRDRPNRVAHTSATAELLQLLPSWATATITFAKDKKRRVVNTHGLVLGHASLQVTEISLGSVCL